MRIKRDDPDYWFLIIAELERDYSLDWIAKKVGSSDSSLCRYKAGQSEPRASVARKLEAMHAEIYPANEMPHAGQSA